MKYLNEIMAIKIALEMYSILNQGKSVVAETFIRTLKNKIYKYMTSKSEHVYIYNIHMLIKCNNTYHSTIKVKPGDVKLNTCINSS